MYVFNVNNASMVVSEYENGSKTGMRAIISCYNLDFNLNVQVQSTIDSGVAALFRLCKMDRYAEVLVWNDDTSSLDSDVKKLSKYLINQGARVTVWKADSKEHFESWFTEHDKFIKFIREENGGSFKCGECMWMQRAYPLLHDIGAWVIAQIDSTGDIVRIFKTRSAVPGGGDFYECVRRQNAVAYAFSKARKKLQNQKGCC